MSVFVDVCCVSAELGAVDVRVSEQPESRAEPRDPRRRSAAAARQRFPWERHAFVSVGTTSGRLCADGVKTTFGKNCLLFSFF